HVMTNTLVPVLPLREICLFPGASLATVIETPLAMRALDMAQRTGRRLLALAQKELEPGPVGGRDLHGVGTLAELTEDVPLREGGRRVELDGAQRARVISLIGMDALVAEVEPLEDGDAGDEWGGAGEALARYLHAHSELRSFLDHQRRSADPMSWVNLACQHLPIAASA